VGSCGFWFENWGVAGPKNSIDGGVWIEGIIPGIFI